MRTLARLCLGLFAIVALAAFGCEKKKQGYQQHSFSTRTMKSSVDDVRLPVGLWTKLESVFYGDASAAHPEKADSGHEGGHGGGHGEDQASAPVKASGEQVPTVFMPIKVFLIEKNKGILGGSNYELLFHEGGGEVDLKDFLADRNGTFHIAIETVVEGNEAPPKVFYLSNAKKREIGGQAVGAGCEGYFEITTFFDKSMKGDGIMTNTTAGRHASALAGTYFFAVPHAGKLHLAQLTIKDSRFRQLHCRRG